MCPAYLQHPEGMELPISITGMIPFVIKNEKKEITDGAELQIIAIYAKKFNFKPKLIPATTFGGEDGMIAIVNISLVYTTYFYKIISILTRCKGRRQSLDWDKLLSWSIDL